MKIKKLEIHGFKSFSDRTTFAFNDGVSGIVGPNGCGKSNIVDAIRWVLGEHNARHLRGKLMEDLIFGGSDSRKPVGMAEVTMTLSNEAGIAPAAYANFTEIEIQRRLYRSGESEYFINKVPSRLKDIVDLFTDTGIGTRAYSIIEQGQVGWLINAKPEERREIFEEAAGINKYKHKKEAALRKLEATEQNLVRVTDIISEVKRQLNSLNRQAKKAERYKIFKDELRDLDLFFSHAEYARLDGERGEAQAKLTEAEDKELALSGQVSAKQSAIEGLRTEQLERENDYKTIREKTNAVERDIQNAERSREIASLRIDEIKRIAERLSSDIKEIELQSEGIAKDVTAIEADITSTGATLESERGALKEKEASLDEISARTKEKEDALKTVEAARLELATRLTGLKHAIQSAMNEEENERQREAKFKSDIAHTETQKNEIASPLSTLRQAIDEVIRRKAELDNDIRTTEEKIKSLEVQKNEKTERVKAMKETLAARSARLVTLKEMESKMEGVKEGARVIVSSRKTAGIHGLMADVIETNAGYEKAVEAVLGDRLEYVLVESQKEGIEAVEFLKSNANGRGSFLPVKDARLYKNGNGTASPITPEGARPLVNELNVKEGFSQIINYLFDNVLVVESLDRALSIWKSNGVARTLVTREGELVDPQGVITGGSSNSADGGLLFKRREVKELSSEIETLEREIKSTDEDLILIEREISSLKTAFEEGKKSLHNEDLGRVNREGELRRLEEEDSRLGRKLTELRAELSNTERVMASAAEKKTRFSKEREDAESELLRKDSESLAIAEGVKALRMDKDLVAAAVADTRVKLASTEERLQNLRRQVDEKSRQTIDLAKRIESKKDEIYRGNVEIETKNEEMAAHKEALEKLLAEKDVLKKEEIQKEESLGAFTGKVKALDNELRTINAELNTAVQAKSALSLKLREYDITLTNLKEKTIERYGTSLAEYTPNETIAAMDKLAIEARIAELREKIGAMGEVSLGALEEFEELDKRHTFLVEQKEDLEKSIASLKDTITKINRTTREMFAETFESINAEFQKNFPRFFNGGKAELRLVGEGDVLDSGVEIVASPPGKKLQIISLLSGGEKALTATALIFSIFLIKPSPFCLLDEVDAPLDDANIDRFNGFVKEMSEKSQFILITHNKRTMEIADSLFGITMQEPGVSRMVSVDL